MNKEEFKKLMELSNNVLLNNSISLSEIVDFNQDFSRKTIKDIYNESINVISNLKWDFDGSFENAKNFLDLYYDDELIDSVTSTIQKKYKLSELTIFKIASVCKNEIISREFTELFNTTFKKFNNEK